MLEFYYLYFRLQSSVCTYSYSLTHTGCLESMLKCLCGWGCRETGHPILTCSQIIVFFYTHAAVAVTACSESLNANHTTHLITEQYFSSKGSISN